MSARSFLASSALAKPWSSVRAEGTWLAPAALLLAGAALRLALLLSPLGELDADEAVVGLMARHVLRGELPVFYWGQSYLGSLEAFVLAPFLALFGSSGLVLKGVSALWSLVFVLLAYLAARRAFGEGPALLAALYLALPPAFLAIWSLKTRGGYISLLALGQLLFLLTFALGETTRGGQGAGTREGGTEPADVRATRRRSALLAGAFGLTAGLALWTSLLAVAFLAPAIVYLVLRLRGRLLGLPLSALVAGLLLGAAPLIQFNVANDLASWRALRTDEPYTFEQRQANLDELVRVGGPILVGLAQGTSSAELFPADWATRPGRWWGTKYAILALVGLAVVAHARSLLALARGEPVGRSGAAAYLLLLLLTPLLVSATRLGELISEPRYALPLYATVPLFTALIWRLKRAPAALAAVVLAIFAVNAYSLVSANPWLNLPTSAGASSAATRQELIAFLDERGLTHVYADYWLAYPLAFESGERIVPAVASGGFNRYIPYAHAVHTASRPAFVFVAGSSAEEQFRERLARSGARGQEARVSIYSVYWDLDPVDPLRP